MVFFRIRYHCLYLNFNLRVFYIKFELNLSLPLLAEFLCDTLIYSSKFQDNLDFIMGKDQRLTGFLQQSKSL